MGRWATLWQRVVFAWSRVYDLTPLPAPLYEWLATPEDAPMPCADPDVDEPVPLAERIIPPCYPQLSGALRAQAQGRASERQPLDDRSLAVMLAKAERLEALWDAFTHWERIVARPPGGAEGDSTPMDAAELLRCLRRAVEKRRC